jgi:hypothetical protein
MSFAVTALSGVDAQKHQLTRLPERVERNQAERGIERARNIVRVKQRIGRGFQEAKSEVLESFAFFDNEVVVPARQKVVDRWERSRGEATNEAPADLDRCLNVDAYRARQRDGPSSRC